jgi:hypothetical protein
MQAKLPQWVANAAALGPAAAHLNEMVAAVNGLHPLTGSGGAEAAALRGAGAALHVPPVAGAPTALVRISSASGGGQYLGRMLTGDCTASQTTNPTVPFGLTDPGADDALIINLAEFNANLNSGPAAGNLLSAGSLAIGTRCGYAAGSAGQPLAIIAITATIPRSWSYAQTASQFSWVSMTDATPAVLQTIPASYLSAWTGPQNVMAIGVLRFQAHVSNSGSTPAIWSAIFADGDNESTTLTATVPPGAAGLLWTGTITRCRFYPLASPQDLTTSGIFLQGYEGPATATGMIGQADLFAWGT